MMFSKPKVHAVLLVFCLFVFGCAAPMNKNFPLLETGMSKAEVASLIGQPISAESGPEGTKIQYYRLASSFLDTDGSDTREYFVAFQGDEVIGYGERTDAVTMQRSIIQFNAAWNAANSMRPPNKTEVNVNVDVN